MPCPCLQGESGELLPPWSEHKDSMYNSRCLFDPPCTATTICEIAVCRDSWSSTGQNFLSSNSAKSICSRAASMLRACLMALSRRVGARELDCCFLVVVQRTPESAALLELLSLARPRFLVLSSLVVLSGLVRRRRAGLRLILDVAFASCWRGAACTRGAACRRGGVVMQGPPDAEEESFPSVSVALLSSSEHRSTALDTLPQEARSHCTFQYFLGLQVLSPS